MNAKRWMIMVLVIACGGLAAAPGARAGVYTVYACDGNHGDVNHAWLAFNDDPAGDLKTFSACPAQTSGGVFVHGLRQRTGDGAGFHVAKGHKSGFRFDAPAGTTVVGITYKVDTGYAGSGFQARIESSAGPVLTCSATSTACPIFGGGSRTALTPHTPWVRSIVECTNNGGCTADSFANAPDAALYLDTADVGIEDLNPPAISNLRGSLGTSTAWLSGTRPLGFSAADASGVSGELVRIDGADVGRHSESCDFTRPVPCPAGSFDLAVDTTKLSDGAHSLVLFAGDATQSLGNLGQVSRTVRTDNHAPAAVTNLSVSGGEGWRSANAFSVAWSNPSEGAVAPVVAVHYKLCDSAGANCGADHRVVGDAPDHLDGIAVPGPGDYTVRVWLEDAAGNANDQRAAEVAHLRFDPTPPGAAAIGVSQAWQGDASAHAHPAVLGLAHGAVGGPSGVGGYAVTWDGSVPGSTITTPGPAPSVAIGDLPEGVTSLRVRAISGAGVPSADVSTAQVRIDRHRPEVSEDGAPDAARWARNEVRLSVAGADQPALSGMTPAPESQPPSAGGTITYAVDDGPDRVVRGGTATVRVGADGIHTVEYHATDAAGNESAAQTTRFKVDGTPPGPVEFAPQDPGDPAALNAAATDRTSGVAGGSIEIRKLGRLAWSPLPSSYNGRELHARLDDGHLPPGVYALRARVRDVAGNVATGTTSASGRAERLSLPLRLATRVLVAARSTRSSVCRVVTRRRAVTVRGRRVRRLVRTRACRRLFVPSHGGRTVTVGFGRRVRLYGRLVAPGGQGVAGERLSVTAVRRAGGSRLAGRVRTDRFGRFSYVVAPGASRRVWFRYPGSSVLLASRSSEDVRVPAFSALALSRRTLRVGQTLRFTGRLPGPVPRAGVLVQVQAVVRGRWQTFATPRSDGRGAWAANYTFRATTGVVTYSFRAFIARSADYPYEAGASRVASATVHG